MAERVTSRALSGIASPGRIRSAPGKFRQGDAGHRPHRRVRLHFGELCRMVWRRGLRAGRFLALPHPAVSDLHLENSAKVMLATGLIVAYAYILENFAAWYGGEVYEQAAFWHRLTGPYRYSYWLLIRLNIIPHK